MRCYATKWRRANGIERGTYALGVSASDRCCRKSKFCDGYGCLERDDWTVCHARFAFAPDTSRNRWRPGRVRRSEGSECQRFEVLHDGGEMELVACPGETAEPHAFKAVMNL